MIDAHILSVVAMYKYSGKGYGSIHSLSWLAKWGERKKRRRGESCWLKLEQLFFAALCPLMGLSLRESDKKTIYVKCVCC